jgi:hypothetical protein
VSVISADFDQIIERLDKDIERLPSLVNSGIHRFESMFGWIPVIGDMIKAVLNEAAKLGDELLDKLSELLGGADVPRKFQSAQSTWQTIQKDTGALAASIGRQLDSSPSQWSGLAGGAYATGVASQQPAAHEVSSLASAIAKSCGQVYSGGNMFYGMLLVTIDSCCSDILLAPGPLGLVTALVTAIVGVSLAVYYFLHDVESQAAVFKAMLGRTSAFPGGAWPVATG